MLSEKSVKKVRFVTNNKNKFLEAKRVLSRYNIELEWVNLAVNEVQSDYIEDILISKVMDTVNIIVTPYIVEDTGLFIKALNGFPGPYASYIYKKLGLAKILKLLENTEDREGEFVAIGALVINKHVFRVFKGILPGSIAFEIKGDQGFGYDPIFIPMGMKKTLAEIDIDTKNRISHRGKLFTQIGRYLSEKPV
jgi:XTP/dITP diphosphohydrolase